jgi:beta-lactamase superfamily II metal-dependent hydrolase
MSPPAITLEVLPAGFGDCLLVSCPVGRSTWRMLVDTGPDETYPALRRRLLQIPQDADGKRHIDLFVVSHIDHDHIGGARLLLGDGELGLSFDDIWFNAPPRPRIRGVAEGQSLADILGGGDKALPWNVAWSGQPVSTPADGGGVELTGPGLPKVTLLSPTPDRLADLYRVWAKELERLRRKERERAESEPGATRGELPGIEALAARVTPTDKAVPNGSSIAMLLEHKGASVLLSADAFPTVLVPALAALAKRRGIAGPMPIDVVKLSHHGSRANVTQDLLRAVDARHFVFSTNNSYFRHPNAEAVARVIVGGSKPTLWFNYDTPPNRQWGVPDLMARHGHVARYPEGDTGVTIELPARRRARSAQRQGPQLAPSRS